jgi:hypothetical protein
LAADDDELNRYALLGPSLEATVEDDDEDLDEDNDDDAELGNVETEGSEDEAGID